MMRSIFEMNVRKVLKLTFYRKIRNRVFFCFDCKYITEFTHWVAIQKSVHFHTVRSITLRIHFFSRTRPHTIRIRKETSIFNC